MDALDQVRKEAEQVAAETERYFQLQIEKFKLDLIDRITVSLSNLLFLFVIVFFVFGAIFLICIALVMVIQHLTGNLIISALAAIVFFVTLAWTAISKGRPMIRDSIARALVQSVYDVDNDQE